jgi:hypothetical protein
MEPVIDGGLFEVMFLIVIGTIINFVFRRRYLLMVYSALAISAPLVFLLMAENELAVFAMVFSLFNAILLVTLLWRAKKTNPVHLIDVESLKAQLGKVRAFLVKHMS